MAAVYERNHLDNVICRADFPVVLRLGSESPAVFQEKLASLFPRTSEGVVLEAEMPGGALQNATLKQPITRWEFATRDGATRVLLQRDFLIVSTEKYSHFGNFLGFVEAAFKTLIEVYPITVITRLGLRYQNELLTPGNPTDLNGYLDDALVAHLAFNHGGQLTQEKHALWFDRAGIHVILNYGLSNPDFPGPIRESRVVLDVDCFIRDVLDPRETLGRLKQLNEEATDVFERCIGEKWRNTMHD